MLRIEIVGTLARYCRTRVIGSLLALTCTKIMMLVGDRVSRSFFLARFSRHEIQPAVRPDRRSPEMTRRETVTAQLSGRFLINMF
ncbi:hypothetical protein [Bradyrhizobium huanghuaihaiense]